MPHAIPEELLATTPPSVQALSLAGSGPSLRPCASSRALTCPTVAPGPTRTRSPSTAARRELAVEAEVAEGVETEVGEQHLALDVVEPGERDRTDDGPIER